MLGQIKIPLSSMWLAENINFINLRENQHHPTHWPSHFPQIADFATKELCKDSNHFKVDCNHLLASYALRSTHTHTYIYLCIYIYIWSLADTCTRFKMLTFVAVGSMVPCPTKESFCKNENFWCLFRQNYMKIWSQFQRWSNLQDVSDRQIIIICACLRWSCGSARKAWEWVWIWSWNPGGFSIGTLAIRVCF